MTYEEKLQKIVSKLKEERKLTRKGHKTKSTFVDTSFTKVRIGEICKILLQLQDDEEAIKISDALQQAETATIEQIVASINDDDYENVEVITVELDESFDNWYESYLLQQKTTLKNLDFINMLRIYDVVLDINEQIQLTHKTTVYIRLLPPIIRFSALFPTDTIGLRNEYCDNKLSGLEYLREKKIIEDYSQNAKGWDTVITVSLKLSAFDEFYKKIQEDYIKRNKTNDETSNQKTEDPIRKVANQLTEEDSEIVYKITYTGQRRILINNQTEIGRPDFNSENDQVFSFLYAHPNESFTKEQIEEKIGTKLTKSLHKIVENLGFIGDPKKVFMSVSKNAILFRNPITKQELENIKQMPLSKTIRGGADLILLHP